MFVIGLMLFALGLIILHTLAGPLRKATTWFICMCIVSGLLLMAVSLLTLAWRWLP